MRTLIAEHPLIDHKLTVLRDADTPTPIFAALVDELEAERRVSDASTGP